MDWNISFRESYGLTVAYTLLILCSQPGEVQSLAPVIETLILLGLLENFLRPWAYWETSLFSSLQTSRKWDRITDILKLKLAKLTLFFFPLTLKILRFTSSGTHQFLPHELVTSYPMILLPDFGPYFRHTWKITAKYSCYIFSLIAADLSSLFFTSSQEALYGLKPGGFLFRTRQKQGEENC